MPERSAKKVCQTQLHCRISWGIKLDSAHCLSSRILHSMPGHLRICAMPEATCSRRSPPLPQRPVFSTFLRAGLHFGCRTTSSRDLTATRWGNCTTRGSDTPATRCTTASYRANPPPLPARRAHVAYKTGSNVGWRETLAQHGPHNGSSAKKLGPQAQKRRIWGVLRAQGELFRARHGNYSKSKRSRPRRRAHIVHVKPPAPMHQIAQYCTGN